MTRGGSMLGYLTVLIGVIGGTHAVETEGELVELPSLTVNEVREALPPEAWSYAVVPGFEVLSSLSERETRRVLRDFARLRFAIDAVMPGLQGGANDSAGVLILCGRNGDFARFLPSDQSAERFRLNHLMLPLDGGFAIVVNHTVSQIEIDGTPLSGVAVPTATVASVDEGPEADFSLDEAANLEVDPYRTVYESHFRQLIRRRSGGGAPWFEEGLTRLLGAIDFSARSVSVGRIGDGVGGPRSGDFGEVLKARGLMPMGEFFVHNPEGPDAVWSAQAYAFVHMCLYGRGKRHQGGFVELATEAMRRPVTDELLQRTFGLDSQALGQELRGYVDFTDYRYERFEAGRGQALPEPEPVALRAATEAESGRIVGLVLLAAGQQENARRVMIRPVRRGTADARLLGALGADAATTGDRDRARAWLASAVAQGVDRSEPYLLLARLQWAELTAARPGEPDAGWPLADLAPIIALLETACRRAPARAEIHADLAAMWLRVAESPPPGALGVVNAGVIRFPRNETLLVRAARLNVRHGDPAEARELIDYGMRVVRDPAARALLRTLRAEATAVIDP